MVVHTCNPSTEKEAAGESAVQGHPQLPRKLNEVQCGLHETVSKISKIQMLKITIKNFKIV